MSVQNMQNVQQCFLIGFGLSGMYQRYFQFPVCRESQYSRGPKMLVPTLTIVDRQSCAMR